MVGIVSKKKKKKKEKKKREKAEIRIFIMWDKKERESKNLHDVIGLDGLLQP